MAIGPIPPIHALPVMKSPERREEWPVFNIENTARVDEEHYHSGGGQSDSPDENQDSADSFEQQLASAEEEAETEETEAPISAEQPSEDSEPSSSVNFFV